MSRKPRKAKPIWTPDDITTEEDEYAARRGAVWRQLIQEPDRDLDTMVWVCAEYGIDVTKDYVRSTRARWRNTIEVLREEGFHVPG